MAEIKIQKLKRIIEKHFESSKLKLDKIVLFGSYAEGKQKADSDVDILLISRNFRDKNYDNRFIPILDLNKELVKNLNKPVDLLYYSDEEWENDQSLIIREAKQHGKVIYG